MNPILNFHDARLSLIQSAIKHVVVHGGQAQSGLAGDDDRMQAASQHLAALQAGTVTPGAVSLGDAEICIKLLVEYGLALLTHNTTWQQQVLDQYKDSPCDPGWLEAVASYVEYYWVEGKSPEYYDVDSGRTLSYALPAPQNGTELVVGVLGDWGTGEPVALAVLELLMAQKPDVILHVGDIYYSGTMDEAQQNFLALVQTARSQPGAAQVPVFTIPGNHDYYSGGAGFYNLIGELNAGLDNNQYIQEASFFNLIGKTWQLQAMDTGYYDSDLFDVGNDITQLHDTEAAWHLQQIQAGLQAGRKVILFSHHQLFSALLNIGANSPTSGPNFNPNLQSNFKSVLGQVSAWFWGHEHLLELYSSYQGLSLGRCIGYSAFPVLTDGNPYNPIYTQVPLDTSVELGTTENVYNHGFTVLRLNESTGTGTAEYYSVPGDATPGSGATSTLLHCESF